MKFVMALMGFAFGSSALAACYDISGTFRGQCQESFRDPSLNKKPELEITISQNQCDSVEIKTKSFPTVYSMTDTFNLKAGMSDMITGPSTKATSGGSFGGGGFSGVVLYTNKDGTGPVVTFFTEYEKSIAMA